MTNPDDQLGPLIRLWGLRKHQLPPVDETPDGLAPFLVSILQEAVPFVDSVAPKAGGGSSSSSSGSGGGLWKPKGSKTFPPEAAKAKVVLSERKVEVDALEKVAGRSGIGGGYKITGPETWSCRKSIHEDAAEPGTASWAEFHDCLKQRHAETEDAFTPTVVGYRQAAVWDCGGVEADEAGETWGHFTLSLSEMRHRIGKPILKDRTFPVLQMTCAAMDKTLVGGGEHQPSDAAAVSHRQKPEFLVVSITVDDYYHPDGGATTTDSSSNGTIVAAYASVERVRKLPDTGEIEWIMATVSDARGVLPKFVQARAVPGQIAKDVALFLSWIARERDKHSSSQPANPVAGDYVAAHDGAAAREPIPSSRDDGTSTPPPAPDPPAAKDTVV
ncbi:hypothetical protein B0H63DRAFT_517238 [Podospora didyma]|uniref:DUF3074 domain-containing protein n=1 Tax=Podospora didyma TaxID=330526 RepID=A0AAE0P679_9PEZI|nr:hypothetical protein B0H63DRAFT_517238 [Podospora didyma]